jgi:predicted nucleotidyltransferase
MIESIQDITRYTFYQKLTALPYVERIILYGSRARGDNRIFSDIDLAIDCPRATNSDWHMLKDIVDDADTLLPIDCVRFDILDEHDPLKLNIAHDGVVIF